MNITNKSNQQCLFGRFAREASYLASVSSSSSPLSASSSPNSSNSRAMGGGPELPLTSCRHPLRRLRRCRVAVRAAVTPPCRHRPQRSHCHQLKTEPALALVTGRSLCHRSAQAGIEGHDQADRRTSHGGACEVRPLKRSRRTTTSRTTSRRSHLRRRIVRWWRASRRARRCMSVCRRVYLSTVYIESICLVASVRRPDSGLNSGQTSARPRFDSGAHARIRPFGRPRPE